MEEGVGFVDMWLNFVGRMIMIDGLHLTGKQFLGVSLSELSTRAQVP